MVLAPVGALTRMPRFLSDGRRRRAVSLGVLVPALLAIVLAPSAPLPGSDPETATAGMMGVPRGGRDQAWVLVRKTDGISISTRPSTKGTEDSIRAEVDVAQPLLVVASIMLDLSRTPAWVSELLEIAVIRTEDDMHYDLQARIGSRTEKAQDVALGAKLAVRADPPALEAELRPSSPPDKVAPDRDPSMAIVQLTSLDGGQRTAVRITIVCSGPGVKRGWCADLATSDWALATMSSLRSALDKGGIDVPPRLKEAVDEASPPPIGNGPSYESVLAHNTESITIGAPAAAPDLTQAELAAPLAAASFVGDCGASDDMKVVVRAAVRAGKAVGVTVRTDPPSRNVASCIDRTVRRLRWKASPRTDFVTTSY
jgi:hypothetical protein